MIPIVVSTWRFGQKANQPAWEILRSGGTALDAVVAGVAVAEEDPEVKSVGYGGYPNAEGEVEVDAAIINGRTLGYGAVTGLKNITNPTALARLVMEKTTHVMLTGNGALQFAREQNFQECNMLTDSAQESWQKWKDGQADKPTDAHDTIGMIAIDKHGDIAAACTTSGVAFKLPGRVGDSPLIGSGLYADNEVGAAAATGQGEEIARTCGSYAIIEHMRQGKSPQEACEAVVQHLTKRVPTSQQFQMAYIAIDKHGNYGGAAARDNFHFAVTTDNENNLYPAKYFIQNETT
ncbi:MAG: N(4)-(beta-N-acetylglucosaminyl)-L-asparaginase [Candidatus Latescibacteria bacterium]|jgi:N4-(beta-N-acetylglucosaminyl)-L-asparaginase|nr:N(4)-(beta-N-acetylglucosaminyl)-L-asparaginase [Candidatus Latescibacterota bacterium]MBT5828900.1 N(4)-(beta-N-acetylglucosaminyl)-L-asparaginase [Candidatus Latescibacterota bacterium]